MSLEASRAVETAETAGVAAGLAGATLTGRINNGCDMANGIGEGHGVGAALDQAVDQYQAERQEVVQELLFDDDEDLGTDVTGALDAPSPLSAMFTPRKRGRPKGSKNRITKTAAAYFLSQFRHPVAVAMEMYSCTPIELAERIGLAKTKGEDGAEAYDNDIILELVKLQVRMVEHSSKYVAQAMPQAVNLGLGDHGDFQLVFGGVSFPARGGQAGETEQVEGAAFSVRLPAKSDDGSRTE